jgi:CheY-like chemotaxis protein
VDDDETARDVVFLKLQEYGALPATVSSTATAIEALESRLQSTDDVGPFDVLLSDIGMPGGDGYDLMRRVRTHPDGRINTIRAIALTAYARFEDRLRALEAGYQTHIAKPVEDSELNTVIAALAGRI